MMAPPKLSIVIVSFNTRTDLERCLESLTANPPAMPYEIVVVDNASSDGSVEAVRRRWPAMRVIVQPENLGFAIDRLAERLRAHPDAAVAGPLLIDGSGRTELSFGRMISPWAELRQKAIGKAYDRGMTAAVRWVARAVSNERYVDWVSGAALLVYRADAEAAGLLDERYFLYTEDVDFCAAIRARGRKVLFTPEATITHLRGRSRATVPGATNAAYRRSQLAFYEKHHPWWAPVLREYLRLKGELPRPGGSGDG